MTKKQQVTALLIFVLSLIHTGQSFAQLKPQHTQYLMNYFLLNPAVAGIDNDGDLKLGYRRQWSGFPGAPVTAYASFQTSINKPDHVNHLIPEDQKAKRNYRRGNFNKLHHTTSHHGIGATLMTDQAGSIKTTSADISYAYHQRIDKVNSLALGASLGLASYRLEPLVFDQPGDPSEVLVPQTVTAPLIHLGATWYQKDIIIGLSANQILQPEIDWATASYRPQSLRQSDLSLFARYRYHVNRRIAVIPSMLVRYVSNMRPSVEAQTMVYFHHRAWVGASYRHNESAVILGGMHLGYHLSLGYSYDMITSPVSAITGSSHEFLLAYRIANRPPNHQPSMLW